MTLRRTIKHYNKNPSRRLHTFSPKAANLRPLQTPATITYPASVGSTLTVTFNEPVTLTGVPGWTTTTRAATSAAQTSPTVYVITFNGALAGTTPMVIPFQDPAFRTYQGGYVQPGSYAIT